MFVGIIKHIKYGTSGNELPPPVKECIKIAEIIDVKTYEEALNIMAGKVLPLRRAAEKKCEYYSSPDGYEWEVISLRE